MNILITGAGGFIGKKFENYFIQKGHEVLALTRKDLDLTDAQNTQNFILSLTKQVDIIIHLAFLLCDSSQSNEKQMQSFKKNMEITENILSLIASLKPKKVLNFSSIAVYPNLDGTYNEKSEIKPSINPEGIYGLAKFGSENILDLLLKNTDIVISHLRLSQVYGTGMREDRIIPVFIKELQEKNTITVFGEGERISNFIEISKLCELTSKFIDNDLPGIYNIGDENLSYYELAQRTIKEYGNKNSKIIKFAKGSRAKFYLDCNKLNFALSTL